MLENMLMAKSDRTSDFRAALWTLTTRVIPKASPVLQSSLSKIAQLLGNYILSPEESEKLYHEIREIWFNEPLEIDPRINLLAYCAWKLRLYLIFDQTESAYQLFKELIGQIRHSDPSSEELEPICLPDSKRFPLPTIPVEHIEFLYTVAEACQQEHGSITIKKIAEMSAWTQQKVISYLNKLEMWFDCLVATEALGLYWVRAEIEIHSINIIPQLLHKFKPFTIRCEVHSPRKHSKSFTPSDFIPQRFSVEFLYPIDRQRELLDWGRKNNLILYRLIEHNLYQNFNVFFNDQWHGKKTTRLLKDAFQTTIDYPKDRIEITKELLRIIEVYKTPAAFSKVRIKGTTDTLLPFADLGTQLGLRENWARQIASNLFKQGILVRYQISYPLSFTPEMLLDGEELALHVEAQRYLYARRETLQPFKEERNGLDSKIYRLYIPEISPNMQQMGFRMIKQLYHEQPPLILVNRYNFSKFCWKSPNLPELGDFKS
jgi:hypothetical protein